MNTKSHSEVGFSIVEVLIALVLIGIVLSSVVINSVHLAQAGSRAEVQAVEASAADSLAQYYADHLSDLPGPGEHLEGSIHTLLPEQNLKDNERAIWGSLSYVLQRQSTGSLQIILRRQDLSTDPDPLQIEIQP